MPVRPPAPEKLFHHRWAIPVLAELYEAEGCKFITLVRRLGVSRDALRRTLLALMRLRLAKRNPGYGHPLRPEYVLTARGKRLAPQAVRFLTFVRQRGMEETVMDKWSMPVLLALRDQPVGFSALRRLLPNVTGRALALALKELAGGGLLDRAVLETHPPSTRYALTEEGRRVVRAFVGAG